MQRNDEPGNPTSGREFDTEDFAGTSEERGEPDPLFALRYRLESELGCGGMGTVFRAWDTFLDVPVALKSLHWDKQHHEAANHVLRRELLSARLVTHRNVCRVYDSGCDQTKGTDRWFLTMEFLPGQTLRQRLAALGPMTAREALPIVTQLVDGLAAAHGAGVAHLDLKTANVMLSPEPHGAERVVIMDFGIAKLSANLVPMVRDRHEERSRPEPRRSFGGTPGYMAPEQSRGSHVGPHSDIYALGVVLHELRTGRLPGDTSEASLEPEWKVVIDRCLSEDPKDRFGRVQDVAHALGCGSVPPSFTAVTPTRSIPSELDPFVGRSQELVTIDGWLSSGNRLVTILGPAGIGKTRLAIHYSNSRKSAWEGGVWFVDLSAADESTLAVTIAHGIGIEPKSGDPVAAVGRALATRGRALVVLDNVDALVIPCGALLRGWFDSTDASFLATSREVLALRGEQVLSVDPLDTDQAIELFVDRARRSYPGFSPSEEDTSIVRRIVQLVDHLPLAIELAASRVRVVGLLGLESRLEDRLKVLTSRGGDRHSSLRGAIDASWDLLDASERMAWTQCAVFEGGFQLEDAEAVLDLGDDGPWVVDAIQSLVDKSLIRAGIPRLQSEPSAYRAVRFGMFPSLRQYALEKLAALGDDAVCSAKAAHMRHFARLSALPTEPDTVMEMLQRQVDDVENYTSAFRTALELADDQCAAELTFAMTGLLMRRGDRWGDLFERALSICTSPVTRGRVLAILGRQEWRTGRLVQARAHLIEAKDVLGDIDDPYEAHVAASLGAVLVGLGEIEEAERVYRRVLELAAGRDLGDALAIAHNGIGSLRYLSSGPELARESFETAARLAQERGQPVTEAIAVGNLAAVHFLAGRTDDALRASHLAASMQRAVGDLYSSGGATFNVAIIHVDRGEIDLARDSLAQAQAIARHVGDRRIIARVLLQMGDLHFHEDDAEAALGKLEAAATEAAHAGDSWCRAIASGLVGEARRLLGDLSEARRLLDESIEALRALNDTMGLPLISSSFALLCVQEGDRRTARSFFDESEAMARTQGNVVQLCRILGRRGIGAVECGDLEDARRCLEELEGIVASAGFLPGSPIGKLAAELRERTRGNSESAHHS